ncbi:MAG: ABC transporter ATP-binding protein [Trueperaceae bacterium]
MRPPAPSNIPILSIRGIHKRFPGVVANDDVGFEVYPGEVHALLGENGAGKTTLISILYGLQQPDEGQILLEGRPVRLQNPRQAKAYGIGLVAQHFHLARRHTVAENIALGLPDTPFLRPTRKLEQRIHELGEHYGLDVDPTARVWQLSPGEQQRVEIMKALLQGARLLILDEPTSVLTPQEAQRLLKVLDQMTSEGKGVIFISHKLNEVIRAAKRITVLRKGRVVGRLDAAEATAAGLARLMVGDFEPPRSKKTPGGERSVARLEKVFSRNHRGLPALRGVSFDIRGGEILGVAGVAGNGQAELVEVVSGLRRPDRGHFTIMERDVTELGVRALLDRGVALIPEDRNHMGTVPAMSVAENLVLRQYRKPPYARAGLIDWRAVAGFAKQSIARYEIATPDQSTRARLLSGGNVQKLILARELAGEPKLVVAAHPTYGLDVGAAALTHDLLLSQRERGAAVLLVSEDLDELLALADRILVMSQGQVAGIVEAASADREQIGLLMAGTNEAAGAVA